MARVLLAVPSFEGTVKSKTVESLYNMDRAGNDVEFRAFSGYGVERARAAMAKAALDGGFDYLLMVDSDMVAPRDGLARLIGHELRVCMGWAVRGSSDEGLTSVIKPNTIGYHESWYDHEMVRKAERGEELVEVKGNGMAFALVHVDVFRRVNPPWFRYVSHPDGSALGEDYWFCMQCTQARIPLYVDTRVGCGHIHDRILGPKL